MFGWLCQILADSYPFVLKIGYLSEQGACIFIFDWFITIIPLLNLYKRGYDKMLHSLWLNNCLKYEVFTFYTVSWSYMEVLNVFKTGCVKYCQCDAYFDKKWTWSTKVVVSWKLIYFGPCNCIFIIYIKNVDLCILFLID